MKLSNVTWAMTNNKTSNMNVVVPFADLGSQFRQVVRISQLSGDIQSEITRVFNCVVTQFDAPHTT